MKKRIVLYFEYDGPNDAKVTDRSTELAHIRENMPPVTSYYHDSDGFTIIIWDIRAGTVEAYVFDDGRPTTWYFTPKNTAVDAWWRRISSKGENTAVAAEWIHKHIKRYEVQEESARLAYDFILCLKEMRGSEKGSSTWEYARLDARGMLADMCDLAGVPAEDVMGFDV